MASGPAGRFLAAGHGLAVIADAVGQQEIEVRIADRQRCAASARSSAMKQCRQARQQIDGAIPEAIGEAQRIAEARGDAGLGPMAGSGVTGFGRSAPVCTRNVARPSRSGAQEIQAALGLLPVLHHHVFQLFVQELFGRLFDMPGRLRRSRPARPAA